MAAKLYLRAGDGDQGASTRGASRSVSRSKVSVGLSMLWQTHSWGSSHRVWDQRPPRSLDPSAVGSLEMFRVVTPNTHTHTEEVREDFGSVC